MKFQGLFFVLFALASSLISMFAVVSAQDPPSNTTTTTAAVNASVTTASPPLDFVANNTVTNSTTDAVPSSATNDSTTTANVSSSTNSTGNDNRTESNNNTTASSQDLVGNISTNTTTTTTTQSPPAVSEACLKARANYSVHKLCKDEHGSIHGCSDQEYQILFKYDCWLFELTNSTGLNVSDQCIERVTECLLKAAGSPHENSRSDFCRQDKEHSDCFTNSSNSSSVCLSSEYEAVRKASDCSSSRRVAEACTLIVLLASVVALALTSD